MKRLLAVLLIALFVVFVCSCGKTEPSGSEDAASDAPVTEAVEPEVPVKTDADLIAQLPEVEPVHLETTPASSVEEAVDDYYRLQGGDYSVLGKFHGQTVKKEMARRGYFCEYDLFGRQVYSLTLPFVIKADRFEELFMTDTPENEQIGDNLKLFIRTKLEGLYVEEGLAGCKTERDVRELQEHLADLGLSELPEESVMILDTSISRARLREMDEYIRMLAPNYTRKEALEDMRNAGYIYADETGSVRPFFDPYDPPEVTDESVTVYKRLTENEGFSLEENYGGMTYKVYDYLIDDTTSTTEGERFDEVGGMIRDDYGIDVDEIVFVDVVRSLTGMRNAFTGETEALGRVSQDLIELTVFRIDGNYYVSPVQYSDYSNDYAAASLLP